MTDSEKKIEPPDMASTNNSPNSIPDDPTEHTDLADIIRCAMTKIKIGECNNRSRKCKRKF